MTQDRRDIVVPGMKPVKSSMVSSVGYDAASRTMVVSFPNGKRYAYEDVSQKQHDDFVGSESVGRHFGQHIRGQFQHRILPHDDE